MRKKKGVKRNDTAIMKNNTKEYGPNKSLGSEPDIKI